MASVIPFIKRDDVEELEGFVGSHPGVDDEWIIKKAVEFDSLKIVKEWVRKAELLSVAVEGAQAVKPGKVIEWLIEDGHMKDVDDFRVVWSVWLRLLKLDEGHACYPTQMAESLRAEPSMNGWVAASFMETFFQKGTLEELEWFTEKFGDRILEDLHWRKLACNPHADVVEKYYSRVLWDRKVRQPWSTLAKYSTPEAVEVMRRLPGNPVTGDPAGKFPRKPSVGTLREAMEYGNLKMYRYMREEFGMVAKSSEIMCLACCRCGDADDVREYWMTDAKVMTWGVVLLFVRGMYELVKELMAGSQPDADVLVRRVDAHSWEVGVLRGMVYMGWRGFIPKKRKSLKEKLAKTAIENMYWPWFQGKISEKGVFFTVDEVLGGGLPKE